MKAIIPLLAVVVAVLAAVGGVRAAERATSQRAARQRPLLVHVGEFTLTQADDPAGCRFSGSPFTSGEIDLIIDWENSLADVFVTGQGSGTRRDLRCDEFEASFTWTAEYTIDATGFIHYGFGEFELSGVLDGTGSTVYFDCTQDGEPAACPPNSSGPYSFPVTLTGEIDCATNESFGVIEVHQIGLPTGGGWSTALVREEDFTYVRSNEVGVTLNERPVPVNCAFPVMAGDEFKLDGQSSALYFLCRDIRYIMLSPIEAELLLRILIDVCAGEGLRQDEPAVELLLEDGAVAARYDSENGGLRLLTGQLTAESEGPSAIDLSHDPAGNRSVLRLTRGTAAVLPQGASDAFPLQSGQQVDVTNGVAGPVIDLLFGHLPLITGGP